MFRGVGVRHAQGQGSHGQGLCCGVWGHLVPSEVCAEGSVGGPARGCCLAPPEPQTHPGASLRGEELAAAQVPGLG